MNFNELVSIEDSIDTLTTTKQDILTAGDNITIVDNVISSSGNIIYPVLSVCRSTDFIINSSSNDTYMPFDVVVVDNYNGFNTSNGQYTIPIDGVYYIGASVSSMNSTTRKLYVDILKGGVSIFLMLSQNLVTGDNFYHNTGVIKNCTAGQSLRMIVRNGYSAKGTSRTTLICFKIKDLWV